MYYTVSFDATGGSFADGSGKVSQQVASGGHVTLPEEPTREDYVFLGWFASETDTSPTPIVLQAITADTTLVARWLSTDPTDTDKDGIPDAAEDYFGTDPTNPDTDGDGIPDDIELTILGTDPTQKDSDGNGIPDGDEDQDGDGLTNLEEVKLGTDPALADTDGDGLSDGAEANTYGTDPLKYDTDGDGASDGKEIELGTDPLKYDASFTVTTTAPANGDTVTPSVSATLTGEQIETLTISPVHNETFFPSTIPGYLGGAYDFRVAGDLSTATISFQFDPTMLQEGAVPTIYYFNEEAQQLEPLETTVSGYTASATVTHFSTYILIDRTVFQKAFTWEDVWDASANYTGVEAIFVIDDSGSMISNDKTSERLTVARDLIDALPQDSKIGVVQFASTTTLLTGSLTTDRITAKSFLSDTYFKSNGGTYMYEAINSALDLYTDQEGVLKVMIVLSDGQTSNTHKHDGIISDVNKKSVKVYTVGLGSSTSYFTNYLKPLAESTGAAFYLAADASQLAGIYQDIGKRIDIETDSDNDGIPDYYEEHMVAFNGVTFALDKNDPDTDGDGIPDGDEVKLVYTYSEDRTKVQVVGKIFSDPCKADSDGDGLRDKDDAHPWTWDVCARDLAMFAALSYEDASTLQGSFYPTSIDQDYYWLDFADLGELSPYWTIVHHTDQWTQAAQLDKFSATTYRNGNAIVIAYRGTNDGLWEWADNVLCYGLLNYHAEEALTRQYAEMIYDSYVKGHPDVQLYITGHSLGGYLAQIGTAELVETKHADQLEKVGYFNGIGMAYNKVLNFLNKEKDADIDALKQYGRLKDGLFGSYKTPNGKLTSYHIKGDWVSMLGTHYGEEIGYYPASAARAAHAGQHGTYDSFWDSLKTFTISTLGVAVGTVAASPEVLYYYALYGTHSFIEYTWITHETDSFLYHLTQGTRGPSSTW